MMWRFSAVLRAILARARQIASEQGSGIVGEAHLFLAVLELANDPESPISILLAVSGVSRDEARLYAQSAVEIGPPLPNRRPRISLGALRALRGAVAESGFDNNLTVEARHLFIACLMPRRGAHLGEVMRPLGLDAARLRAHLRGLRRGEGPYRTGNPLNRLTPAGERATEAARLAARAGFCGRIGAAHLLLGVLGDQKIVAILQSEGCDVEDLKQRARALNSSDGGTMTAQPKFAPDAQSAIEAAAREAKRARRLRLDVGDILLALLPPNQGRQARRNRDSNRDAVAGLWTPAQGESLRLALGGGPELPAAPRREEFTNLKLMGFLQVVNVVFSAVFGLIIPLFFHWVATGTYTRAQYISATAVFFRYLIGFGLVAGFCEGVFFSRDYQRRNVAGMTLGAAIGYLWSRFF